MRTISLFLIFTFFIISCNNNTNPEVSISNGTADIWLTTGDSLTLLSKVATLPFQDSGKASENIIQIDESQTFQTILGFGASMTGSSAYVLTKNIGEAKRQEVMNSLFSKEKGIGLSYMRMTVGASDFSSHNYSYNDPPAGKFDSTLEAFSINEDKDDVIPRIKEAFAINNDLALMASPWSAPAFMKTTGNMIKGKLRPEAQPVFANYFVKFIKAFEQEGIPIQSITIQNEPEFEPPGYPGMLMTAEEQRDFIKNHLGPTFKNNNISSKIVIYDHNWDHPNYPLTILSDPKAKQYVDGSAFHCYAGDVNSQTLVHNTHPDKNLYFTECSGGTWSGSWRDNLMWNFKNLIIGNLRNWQTCVLLWNIALDEKYGPLNGGCPTCRGIVTVCTDGVVEQNIEYYTLGHVSKFVRKGAKRIFSTDLTASKLNNVAFINPDGSKALIVMNENEKPRSITLQTKQGKLQYDIPAYAVITVAWK